MQGSASFYRSVIDRFRAATSNMDTPSRDEGLQHDPQSSAVNRLGSDQTRNVEYRSLFRVHGQVQDQNQSNVLLETRDGHFHAIIRSNDEERDMDGNDLDQNDLYHRERLFYDRINGVSLVRRESDTSHTMTTERWGIFNKPLSTAYSQVI